MKTLRNYTRRQRNVKKRKSFDKKTTEQLCKCITLPVKYIIYPYTAFQIFLENRKDKAINFKFLC